MGKNAIDPAREKALVGEFVLTPFRAGVVVLTPKHVEMIAAAQQRLFRQILSNREKAKKGSRPRLPDDNEQREKWRAAKAEQRKRDEEKK